jgi:NAD(P)-dependent dehydrogenase (short-subunit alcohol dehydrogenase family)
MRRCSMGIRDLINLQDRVAIVTGASRGLGQAFATALAEAGAHLVITCRHGSELRETSQRISSMGREVLELQSDVNEEEQVIDMVAEARKKFGRIDILVNNAASMRTDKPPEETSLEEWKSVIEPNINGLFLCSREVAKVMIPQKRGKIINLSSVAGYDVLKYFHGGSYEVSKAAVIMITKTLATEWAVHNINVNAIAPGYYNTIPNQRFLKKEPGLYDRVLDLIPLKRLGDIEELAGLVVVLASDISNFMTGTTIVIDGGYTCW